MLYCLCRRKGGIKLKEEGEEKEEEEDADSKCEDNEQDTELERRKKDKAEALKKARVDEIWADFKKDTKRTQAAKPASPCHTEVSEDSGIMLCANCRGHSSKLNQLYEGLIEAMTSLHISCHCINT